MATFIVQWPGPLRVLVCGHRNYRNYERVLEVIKTFKPGSLIIFPRMPGAASLAGDAARECGLAVMEFPGRWLDYFTTTTDHERNAHMIAEGRPDLILAFCTTGRPIISGAIDDLLTQAENRHIGRLIFTD